MVLGYPATRVLTEENILGMSKTTGLGVMVGTCDENGVPDQKGDVVGGALVVVGFEHCGVEDIDIYLEPGWKKLQWLGTLGI